MSFTAPAASPACWRTAEPTRFTRSSGDCFREEPFRDDPPRFAPPLELEPELAERLLDRFEPERFADPPDEPLRAELFFAAPRAVGRRADDFFADDFFADERFAPRFAPPRLAPPRLAPPRLADERLLPDFPAPRLLPPERDLPRDLALVAI